MNSQSSKPSPNANGVQISSHAFVNTRTECAQLYLSQITANSNNWLNVNSCGTLSGRKWMIQKIISSASGESSQSIRNPKVALLYNLSSILLNLESGSRSFSHTGEAMHSA